MQNCVNFTMFNCALMESVYSLAMCHYKHFKTYHLAFLWWSLVIRLNFPSVYYITVFIYFSSMYKNMEAKITIYIFFLINVLLYNTCRLLFMLPVSDSDHTDMSRPNIDSMSRGVKSPLICCPNFLIIDSVKVSTY